MGGFAGSGGRVVFFVLLLLLLCCCCCCCYCCYCCCCCCCCYCCMLHLPVLRMFRKIQKMTPPNLQFETKKEQNNTGPNDTLKTYMPIFSTNRNSFRAWVWPNRHIAKWVAGGAPPEGVFNKNSRSHAALQFVFSRLFRHLFLLRIASSQLY